MVDARVWRIGVSEWVETALKGMRFQMSLRRHCSVVRIGKKDVGRGHIRLLVQRRIPRKSCATVANPENIPLGWIAIRAVVVGSWMVRSAI